MILLMECFICCLLFTIVILPPLYRDPLSLIMSFPPNIIRRVEQLPQYQGKIKQREKAHLKRKLIGVFVFVGVLSAVAYGSGCRDFLSAFLHVFLLFSSVNLYDLVVLDWGISCHSKRIRIKGTEDMEAEYKDYLFHAKGAIKGTILGFVIAVLSGGLISLVTRLI